MRLLVLALAAAAALALPAAASARPVVGISENQPTMFSDPLFPRLGTEHARLVVSYDVATRRDDELTRVRDYLHAADVAGVEVLVSFNHSRGDSTICGKRRNRRRAVCRLPSRAEYRRNVRAFLAAFPSVRLLSPWNEVNHFTQPTSRNPRRAAQFTNIAAKLCRRCRIVAADVLDQADSTRARRPTFRRTSAYIRKFRRALKVPRRICGVHNYSDVNRFRSTGTRALIRALGCRQIWLTETGGLYRFGSFWTKRTRRGCRNAAACQLKATKYMFRLARRTRRIKRVYVYSYFGRVTPRFDAGLVDSRTGRPRKAFREVRRRV